MKKLADFALHALQWEQSAGRFYISILQCKTEHWKQTIKWIDENKEM